VGFFEACDEKEGFWEERIGQIHHCISTSFAVLVNCYLTEFFLLLEGFDEEIPCVPSFLIGHRGVHQDD